MNPYDKTREALEAINCIDTRGLKRLLCELVESDIFDGGLINKTISAVEKARRALSLPRRNCDVGTADEQMSRYCKFTDRYNPCSYKGYARCAEDCPIHIKLRQEGNGELQCQLEWAQMPYTP